MEMHLWDDHLFLPISRALEGEQKPVRPQTVAALEGEG